MTGTNQFGWPLEVFALAIIAAAAAEAICRFFARLVVTSASRRVEYDLRNRYFADLETLEPAFFERFRTGDLVARDERSIGGTSTILFSVLNTVLVVSIALVLMFPLSPPLATWVVIILPAATALPTGSTPIATRSPSSQDASTPPPAVMSARTV